MSAHALGQVAGLEEPLAAAVRAYAECGRPDSLQVNLQKGVAHTVTAQMDAAVEAFFCRWLLGAEQTL